MACENHRNKNACCEGIRLLTGADLKLGDGVPPMSYLGNQEYSFAYRPVEFCPSCGKRFEGYIEGPLPPEVSPDDIAQLNDQNFCCATMEGRIAHYQYNEWEDDFEIFYQPFTRRYFFSESRYSRHWDLEEKFYKEWDFYYCPHCGKKLPSSLLNEWLQIVKYECGTVPETRADEVLSDIPEEFKTEEWWRKRGL